MEDTLFRGSREPSLDQILCEPIVQTIMRRDGADPDSVRRMMRNIAGTAMPPDRPKLRFTTLPDARKSETELPQASAGVLAQAGAPRWPRVFPSL